MQLPAGVQAQELVRRAAQRGVLIELGDVFFISHRPPANYVRLGYQSIPAHAIEEGIAVLAEVLHGMEADAQ